MKRAFAAIAATLAGCTPMPQTADLRDAPASLAAAESAFAAQSVREGMRAAFLAWLAPDATIYRDGPVNGPSFVAAHADPPIILDWRPVFVEVAASGEMGLSTGPCKITSRKDPSAPPRHGQFVSLWKREPGGPWRVRVDLGISHPGPVLAEAPLQAGITPPPGADRSTTLAEAEARFALRAARDGNAGAYAAAVSPTVRLYREGQAPFLGRESALASPVAREGVTEWTVEAHEASASGDFGYATGRYGPPGGATAGHYLRVWRREPDGWRIALDVVNARAPR
ncbi:MAG TPA: nuclear transport factor 2 family protein [Usitatibacteraceae bacterium]|nr:nuclear transport factor 2 family protein [Usitatibacteraceae bacterium]